MTAAPAHLTVDHLSAPTGVAVERPVLAWQPAPDDTCAPTHYELEVRRLSPAGQPLEPPVWATGRRPQSTPWVTYDGEPLASDADYVWRVRTWAAAPSASDGGAGRDEARPHGATPGPWVEAAFSTSLLRPAEDVRTAWVEPEQTPATPEPPIDFAAVFGEGAGDGGPAWDPGGARLHPVKLIRQELALPVPADPTARLLRARLFTSAQGVLDLSLDGAPVGDSVLAPGWTTYSQYAELDVHDVTAALTGPVRPGGTTAPAGEQARHVLGIRLADGWYAGRTGALGEAVQYGDTLRAWWQLSLTYSDGTTAVLGPDASARTTEDGPLRYSDILVGERRDDRRAAAVEGWDRPGFDEAASAAAGATWRGVRLLAPVERPDLTAGPAGPAGPETPGTGPLPHLSPATRLEPFRGAPARRVLELEVAEVLTTPAGETVLDLGQVIAGRVRLAAVGPAGTEIVLEHSEHLAKDGTFFSNVVGPNKDQRDVWVLAGTGTPEHPEVFEPAFTFHGFRYVRVTGYPGALDAGAATGVVIASDLEAAGSFACSDARLTRLHENVVWSQRANFLWIPTDCPQRERTGWTGDAQVFAPAATNNADVLTFLARWLRNVRADQRPDGSVMNMSPWPPLTDLMEGIPGPGGITVSAGWGDAVIRVPLALYERYGDTTVLAENLGAMRAWVAKQSREAASELPERLRADGEGPLSPSGWAALDPAERARQRLLWNAGTHFGDWLTPSTLVVEVPLPVMEAPRRTGELVASAYHAEALRTLARVERALGHEAEAAALRERWEAVREAVAAEYVAADGRAGSGLQGEQVLVLAFELVADPVLRGRVADRLASLVREAGDHLDTGFLSTPFLLDVLLDTGHEESAWAVLMQDTLPSWLYEVEEGATTIWESWAAVLPDGTVGTMSFNHYSLGAVDDVLFRRVAGLAPAAPGFSHVRVAPLTQGPLSWAEATRRTPYGEVRVRWEREADGAVSYDVTLPAGITGEVVLADGSVHGLPSGRTLLTV
ncbi:family 78 glycoside hydrolase catalytic domain [Actinomyces sp. 186855]|uniref:family 78 glycoside hydrolase catalytic domain n=6 Tax=Actinomyces TaxID=1654 RepID=UPI002A26FE6E|nr:family 78 glycoside hydrolase catalytic domain [Actinomyces sp. AC-20-1]MCL3792103.1 family 78 glycoside hydrolase catalytic domain [Actinomyces sp. 186855]MCL3793864.1 family 78 glycoside hydrolase catalytic domain [Actinomyces sp. 217892]